jgi:hypothetical protein
MRSDNRAVTDWHLKQVRADLPIRGKEDVEEPVRGCPTCGAPADEAGTTIPEHRPAHPAPWSTAPSDPARGRVPHAGPTRHSARFRPRCPTHPIDQ